MRYPKEHKAETRERILDAAARLFRERGYEGVGVDAIMSEVGLTAGGFYSHFDSKEALLAEATAAALDKGKALSYAKSQDVAEPDALRTFINSYLSRYHRDHTAEGCPFPALTQDVARSSNSTRESYERQLQKYVKELESLMPEGPSPARDRALALVAQCVGGIMLSRAVKDEKLSDRILKACRQAAMKVCDQ